MILEFYPKGIVILVAQRLYLINKTTYERYLDIVPREDDLEVMLHPFSFFSFY